MQIKVSVVEKENEMMTKVVEIIQKHLKKPKSETFLRKPILIFTQDIDTAETLLEFLRKKITEVRKMSLLHKKIDQDSCFEIF